MKNKTKSSKVKWLAFFAVFLIISQGSFSQNIVNGRVISQNETPITGASILVKGSQAGTTTDENGSFKITVKSDDVLVISSVGFISKEVNIAGRSDITEVLTPSSTDLDEVVVIGYGTQKKGDISSSISSISEKDLQSRPVESFQGAMQGRSSGVQISQTGGDLEGRFSINIRGAGTITSSNQPLIVVDGVPLSEGTDFSFLNPEDISSIDILKDASATAIFGARASNGVVMVTTRRGKSGKTSLSLNSSSGFERISKIYNVLTSEQQRQLFVEGFKNTNRSTLAYENPDDPVWKINNNWQRLATRSAFRQNYYLTASGGSENNQFLISGGILKREGVMKNTDLTDYYFRANNNVKIGNRFSISSSLAVNHSLNHYLVNDIFNSGGSYENLVSEHTYLPAYDEDGNLAAITTTADPYFGAVSNPLINILLPTRYRKNTRFVGNVKADYEIVKDLVLSGNLGTQLDLVNGFEYLPVFSIGIQGRDQGNTTNNSGLNTNWVLDATLQYNKKVSLNNFTGLVGYSVQQFHITSTSTNGTGTQDNLLNQLSNQSSFNASSTNVESGLQSVFARLNYDYDGKYLVTGTIRRDGSSKFGPESKFGWFPSGSIAWNLAKESFFNSKKINELKIRISYGATGNQNIPDFAYVTRAQGIRYAYGNDVVVGNRVFNLGNPILKWESAKQSDIGVDISLLNSRIMVTADYYNKKSNNLLVQTPLPLTAGVLQDPTVNLGSVVNKGFEFLVTSHNFIGDFRWTTDFNISFNKNSVLNIGTNSIGEPLQVPGMVLSLPQDFVNMTASGHPIGAFYMYQFDGIWQLNEESAANANGAVPGDPKYTDFNKNSQLDEGDKIYVGSPQPKYYGGLNNTFSYKNISLSVFMNFSGGNKLYNTMRNLNARAVPYNQQLAEVADFWTPDNPSNEVPRPSQGGNTTFLATRVSTRFLEDASFLKLKNVSLSYSLPLLDKMVLKEAKFTIGGTNLLTWTNYRGLDPEVASAGGLISGGIDITPYPPTRYYYLTIGLTF